MQPMLMPRENPNLDTIEYPVLVYPKLDGIRCIIKDCVPLSRTLKEIPNRFIRETLAGLPITGADGELIVGDPTDPDIYRKTNSAVMSRDGEPDFTYYIFDIWNSELPLYERINKLKEKRSLYLLPRIEVLFGNLADDKDEVLYWESQYLNAGYEGVILRNPKSLYKFGRCTMKENNSFKLKRFADDEAIIIGFEEEMHNGNDAEVNELGRTKRSTAKDGLTGKGTLGALICTTSDGVEFKIGSGFNQGDRQAIWNDRQTLLGSVVKYKHFPIGVKDKPRFPIFLGFRNMEIDG
jgi:DNA ligase 1